MQPHIRQKPSRRRNLLPQGGNASYRATASADLEFGRFRVLLRRRQLLADGVPIELGTRAFDLLLVLLEADGSLVTKEELMSRVWPGIVVSEENIKFQISTLRKALGADRHLIHTEFGRGYRFTGVLRSDAARDSVRRPRQSRAQSGLILFAQSCRRSLCCIASSAGSPDFSSQPPGAKTRRAPLAQSRDAADRREPSAPDRSALSCRGEET